MAKGLRMGIRLSQEEHQQIQEAVRRLEYKGPSALVRRAIHNELVYRFNKTYTYYSAPSASNFFHR